MASGADHFAAAEQALAVAVASDSAMALRAADVHASLALAAAYVAAAVQSKNATTALTNDMTAFTTALTKTSPSIAAIKVVTDAAGKALGITTA